MNENRKDDPHSLDCWTWGGWETDRHYRRMGTSGTLFFGNGEWIEAWRQRMVSQQTIRMMVDSGVTLVVTHFYKGFGIDADSTEWPRLKKYVKDCQAAGLRVWGYVQGRSLYRETLFAECPEATDWVARKYDGTEQMWGGKYYRLAPCMTAPGYLQYMLRVIETGLTDMGLDGIHLDNSYSQHCYCERCRRLFRDFLNQLPDLEELTGLPCADQVEPPPVIRELGFYADPILLLWLEFGTQKRLEFLRALYAHIKQIKPQAVLHTNPAFPKQPAAKLMLALDPVREGTVCDFVCAENAELPRVHEGRIFSQVQAYLFAQACGYRVLHTSWCHGPGGSAPIGNSAGFWTGLAEEFSHHSAILGNNWLLRATGDGDAMLADKPGWRECHAEAVHYFRGLHRDLKLGSRQQWAEAGIYINPDTFSQAGKNDLPAFHSLILHLLMRGVPMTFVIAGQPIPPQVKTLFVCQQSCLSDRHMNDIAGFAAMEGRGAWIAGESGRYNEWGRVRNTSGWLAWRQSPGFVADCGKILRWAECKMAGTNYFAPSAFNVSPQAVADIDAFLASPHWSPSLWADLPQYSLINTENTPDSRLLVHIRDQSASDKPIAGVRIYLKPQALSCQTVCMHTPKASSQGLETKLNDDGDTLEICLPSFRHYALCEIS